MYIHINTFTHVHTSVLHVYIYVYTYTEVAPSKHVTCVFLYVFTLVVVCARRKCRDLHRSTCMCTNIHGRAHKHTCIRIALNTRVYTGFYIHVCAYIYTHTPLCLCICVEIFRQLHSSRGTCVDTCTISIMHVVGTSIQYMHIGR